MSKLLIDLTVNDLLYIVYRSTNRILTVSIVDRFEDKDGIIFRHESFANQNNIQPFKSSFKTAIRISKSLNSSILKGRLKNDPCYFTDLKVAVIYSIPTFIDI